MAEEGCIIYNPLTQQHIDTSHKCHPPLPLSCCPFPSPFPGIFFNCNRLIHSNCIIYYRFSYIYSFRSLALEVSKFLNPLTINSPPPPPQLLDFKNCPFVLYRYVFLYFIRYVQNFIFHKNFHWVVPPLSLHAYRLPILPTIYK